jgi:hypothetical protein
MTELAERARAYLDALEADRRAALALSEQKAEEAKLIKARQEGFQAAMALLRQEYTDDKNEADPELEKPVRRRGRRPIRQLILRELSFSGEAMTAAQIARAIDYNPERTETALERLEKSGQLVRTGEGQWAINVTALTQMNGQVSEYPNPQRHREHSQH